MMEPKPHKPTTTPQEEPTTTPQEEPTTTQAAPGRAGGSITVTWPNVSEPLPFDEPAQSGTDAYLLQTPRTFLIDAAGSQCYEMVSDWKFLDGGFVEFKYVDWYLDSAWGNHYVY